jgi:hypothetical protein
MRRWLICLVGLVGCQDHWGDEEGPKAKTPDQVQDDYERQLDNLRAETLDQMHSPSCARQFGGTCGMISAELRRKGARKFIEKNCGETVETVSQACAERFQQTLKTALSRKYSHSIASEVESACQDEPEQCASMELLELQYINSHNRSIAAEWARRSQDIARDAQRAQRNARAAQAAEAREQEGRAEAQDRIRRAGAAISEIGKSLATPKEDKTQIEILKQCSNQYQCATGEMCHIPKLQFSGICVKR